MKCSHGCTIGRLDEKGLFYLRSRGVSEAEARKLMAHAFITEVVERVQNEAWKAVLTALMRQQTREAVSTQAAPVTNTFNVEEIARSSRS
ncbi:MAG: SufD family Fe-S cluster assembly protein [Flavobacteriales bacterium]|nr:SufD family Fe-S cluster assembly protein [Flavobacteriales bacterium]